MTMALVIMATGLTAGAAMAESAGDDASAGGMNRMVPLDPMPITIIQQTQVKGILMVEIYLEAQDSAEVDRINQSRPRLLDAFRTGLNEFAAHEVRLDRLINLDRMELYLLREIRGVLGDNHVRIIYKQIMVQKRQR
jgi:hypothetical protein